jgi:hypothetical protein
MCEHACVVISAGLSEPWFTPEADQAEALAAEAVREMGLAHPLLGQRLTTVAACGGCDCVLFRLDDGSWAIVELTWTKSPPDIAPLPESTRFGSFIAVELGVEAHSADAHGLVR